MGSWVDIQVVVVVVVGSQNRSSSEDCVQSLARRHVLCRVPYTKASPEYSIHAAEDEEKRLGFKCIYSGRKGGLAEKAVWYIALLKIESPWLTHIYIYIYIYISPM